jgi:4-amino-4-deoxy-L-arabinose transferase-like glycosyltransferase
MLSVLAGTATLPVVYLLGRELFGRTAALLGSAMLAMSYTHIHFSRTLFGPIATFLVTVGVYLLVRGLRTGAPECFGFAGGFLAAAMFTYDSARIGPLLAGSAFVLEALRGRAFGRGRGVRWGLLVAGSFVVFAPMLGFAIREPGAFVGRGNVVTLLDPEVLRHSMEKYHADGIVQVLLEQMRRTMLGFHLFGDESPHFAFPRPAVGALSAALLVLGTGFSVRRVRQTPVAILWAWVAVTLLLGGVLTSDPPYWPHLNILLPAVAILAGLGGERVAAALGGERAGLKTAAALLIGGLVLASGVHGWRVYNEFESDNAEPAMRASRYIRRLPRDVQVYLVSGALDWTDDVFRFFNQGRRGEDQTVDGLLRPGFHVKPPAVILLGDQQSELGRIMKRYPGGRVRELRQSDLESPVFVAYELFPGPPPGASSVH